MMKFLTILSLCSFPAALAFTSVKSSASSQSESSLFASRRDVIATAAASMLALPSVVNAAAAIQDSLEIDEFLRTGIDSGGPMGVSSQAGKSRPQTGVVFRDGTDVLQSKNGDVSAEILVGTKADPKAVLVSFTAPFKLETGSVYDVECRDQKTGDGVFLAVTETVDGKSLEELDSSFFLKRLFDPTGRFSFYGSPTEIKVKKSTMIDGQRLLEVSFSNLSQSTNAEIPRNALIVANIPKGTDNAVMLVSSANASRWKKGADATSKTIVDSFSAIPSPKTNLKLRAKDRSGGAFIDF